jgi:hypothetical protein
MQWNLLKIRLIKFLFQYFLPGVFYFYIHCLVLVWLQSKKNYLCRLLNGPVAQLSTCLPAGREQLMIKNMFFVYIIRSTIDGRSYVGITENVENRLTQHNKGMTFSTKGYCFSLKNMQRKTKLEKKRSI